MDLRELQYFVAVAEELHFARAAERVGINQSPLSKAITQMEQHLGVRLFVRTRRSTQLTVVGETLLGDARRILADVDAAHRRVLAVASGRRGRLRLALTEGLAHPRIAKLVALTREQESAVEVSLTHARLATQLAELRAGQLDLGLALGSVGLSWVGSKDNAASRDSPGPAWAGDDIQALPLWKDDLALVARPESPLAKLAVVKALDAAAGTLVVVGEPVTACRERSAHPVAEPAPRIERVPTLELLLTLVAAGNGVGVIGAAQAETIRRPDLIVRPLKVHGAAVVTFILQRSGDSSELVTRFIERARKME